VRLGQAATTLADSRWKALWTQNLANLRVCKMPDVGASLNQDFQMEISVEHFKAKMEIPVKL